MYSYMCTCVHARAAGSGVVTWVPGCCAIRRRLKLGKGFVDTTFAGGGGGGDWRWRFQCIIFEELIYRSNDDAV